MSILIISVSGDSSTGHVMDWISNLGHQAIRYNVDIDSLENLSSVSIKYGVSKNNSTIKIANHCINSKDLDVVWFRKFFNPDIKNQFAEHISDETDANVLIDHNKSEFSAGMHAIFDSWMVNKKSLGGKITKQPSKMEMLIAAKEIGIEIPNTLIANNKFCLEQFVKENKKVVTKAIKNGELFEKKDLNSNNKSYACMYTEQLDDNLIKKIPDKFFLSLFQEALDKAFEIRTFYLDGKTYSSAIFSQSDNQTNVDFRMYNKKKPNRTVPYKLPRILDVKIKKLMSSLGLKTGSLDFIKTKEGKIVFLEVNPWGQYGMVSGPCNYFLDKKIAKHLIKLKNEK